MSINWEDMLGCYDGDELQDAYESEIYGSGTYREGIPDPGDDNNPRFKYPVYEILYDSYYYTFNYLIEKCKERNMSDSQIKDFFQRNLDYSFDEIDDELDDDSYYRYVTDDSYRMSELFYNMLRYIMKNYEHKKCTKANVLSFFVDPDTEYAMDYDYLINEMSGKTPNNGIHSFEFDN